MASAAKPASILLVCLTLAACGGEDQTDGGVSVPATTTDTSASSGPAPKAAPKPRYSGPLADGCRELAKGRLAAMLARLGAPPGALDASAGGDSIRAQCLIRRKGAQLKVTLDAAPQAAQRYANLITESAQFSLDSPELRPTPVNGVGRPDPGGANWIPAYSEVVSLRGNHVLSVNFVAAGVPMDARRRAAIATSLFFYNSLGL